MTKKETLDPRQADFLARYLNPASKTYSNIFQSALDAGYGESYAKDLMNKTDWVSTNIELVTKDELVTKAKKNLKKLLDSDDERVQADITKFVAKTDADFSEKTDITSNGQNINQILVKFIGDDTKDN